MRFLLITLVSRRWGRREELGVGYVAAALRDAGHEGEIVAIDPAQGADLTGLRTCVARELPDLVGVACSHANVPVATLRTVSTAIRRGNGNAHITAGGYFATFNAERLLHEWQDLDSIVVGEGEVTAVELATRLANARPLAGCHGLRLRGQPFVTRSPVHDLDSLAPPSRGLAGLDDPTLRAVSTSRGCQAHCTFCNVPAWTRQFGGGWRGRSTSNIIDELQALRVAHGARRVWFVDSSFEDPWPAGAKRLQKLATDLLEANLDLSYYVFCRSENVCTPEFEALLPSLVSSGLRRVFIGVEAASDAQLKRYAKFARSQHNRMALHRLRTHGIAVRAGWIMISPLSSLIDLGNQVEDLESLGLLHSTIDLFTQLELYTGSAEVTRLRNLGLLGNDSWNDPYDYVFDDARVAPLAMAMRRARDERSHFWNAEAFHTADLVIAGATHQSAVMGNDRLVARLAQVCADVEELKSIQSGFNRLFMSECLALAEELWSDDRFGSLVREYIEGTHCTTAAAVTRVVADLISTCRNDGVEIRY